MTLYAKIGGFMDFLAAPTQNHSQGGATVLYYMHFGMTVMKVFYFVTNSCVVLFRCIVSAIIYYLVHF